MSEVESRQFLRVRGRSLMALVLTPEPPLNEWLATLDAQITRAPSFFDQRPVIVDLGALPPQQQNVATLIEAMVERGIRVIGTEGAHPSWRGVAKWGGPILANAKARAVELPDERASAKPAPAPTLGIEGGAGGGAGKHIDPPSLLISDPVRSGQSVIHEHGDITVIGSVASGAEIIAGGSIHVYGTLRGRAIAGLSGNRQARIFCRKLHAELMAIEGVYKTADDMDKALHGRAVQAWLEGERMLIAALD